MARARRQSNDGAEDGRRTEGQPSPEGQVPPAPGTTGRYLVLMRRDAMEAGVRALSNVAGLKVAHTADFEDHAATGEAVTESEALVFDELAVAVVDTPPEQIQRLGALDADDSGILRIEPERIVHILTDWPEAAQPFASGGVSILPPPAAMEASRGAGVPLEYLTGYREAVNHLVDRILNGGAYGNGIGGAGTAAPVLPAVFSDTADLTWGLQATKVAASRFTGKGVRVAVLDTGMDLKHPDFVGRRIESRSFIPGQAVQDGHGHGTHCIGTACGPLQPLQQPRYGIAYEADIFAGKVLSNTGSGADGGILAGISWAIHNRCPVVSMSLGAVTRVGDTFSMIFETVARRALAAGTLIVAAAGNNRPGPVNHPANCPSILGVGALDQRLKVAPFSCRGLNPQGGEVDIAAPGVQVRSSLPKPRQYGFSSGTSMATPHVAGVAALIAEANPDVRGGALGWVLLQSSQRLDEPSTDAGTGLVQAPVW